MAATARRLLFEPIRVGAATMRNRVAMCPMTTCFADPDGHVTDRQLEFLRARARGGAGMVFTEGAAVHRLSRGWKHHFSAYDDSFKPGLARLAQAIRAEGALACLQLMHNGRRTLSAMIGERPVAPSAVAAEGSSWEVPRALATEEVEEHIEAFVEAAARAADCGWDAVELHGAHGYLLNQFFSPLSNHRQDEFGGSLPNRARFATEAIHRIHARLGDGFPVGVRISLYEIPPGGITVEESQRLVEILERAGAAWIDGSAGVSSLTKELRWTIGTGEATLSEEARRVRAHLTGIPYMTVGRILHAEAAEAVLSQGVADIVGVGRALVADPDWVRKSGGDGDVTVCIGCQACQMRSGHPQSGCPVNVRAGHEYEYEPRPASVPRRVLVMDSGVGGLEAACIAASRGHRVRLACFDGLPFGGLLGLRAMVPGNEEIQETLAHFRRRADRLGVEVLERAGGASAQDLAGADVVVDARPPRLRRLTLPWPSLSPIDAFAAAPGLSGRAAVVGSGLMAAETALFLAGPGLRVTLLCAERRAARDTHPQMAHRVLERLAHLGVEVRNEVDLIGLALLAEQFDHVVQALGFEAAGEEAVGDTWNPWEQRFVAERGMAVGLAI